MGVILNKNYKFIFGVALVTILLFWFYRWRLHHFSMVDEHNLRASPIGQEIVGKAPVAPEKIPIKVSAPVTPEPDIPLSLEVTELVSVTEKLLPEQTEKIAEKQPAEPGVAKVRVDVYMESKCPDTTNFINNQLYPTWTLLKDIIDLHVYPFGKAKCTPDGDDFKCKCQHATKECLLNQVMNCAMKRVDNDPERYLPIIRCIQGNDMTKARQCVSNADLNADDVINCGEGREGRALHAVVGEKTHALNPKVYFIPWIIIDGQRSEDALSELKTTVCEAYKGPRPQACH